MVHSDVGGRLDVVSQAHFKGQDILHQHSFLSIYTYCNDDKTKIKQVLNHLKHVENTRYVTKETMV